MSVEETERNRIINSILRQEYSFEQLLGEKGCIQDRRLRDIALECGRRAEDIAHLDLIVKDLWKGIKNPTLGVLVSDAVQGFIESDRVIGMETGLRCVRLMSDVSTYRAEWLLIKALAPFLMRDVKGENYVDLLFLLRHKRSVQVVDMITSRASLEFAKERKSTRGNNMPR